MSSQFLGQIDWQRPWLAPLRPAGERLTLAADWRATLNELASNGDLRNHRGLPVHFIPQAGLPPDMAYEAYISETGGVPTRDNLHDFFNALVWLSFPKIKVRLNALQATELAKSAGMHGDSRQGVARGKLRDAATIFDENAALLVASDAGLIADLRAHRWSEVFMVGRGAFACRCEVWLFGHALMEKLATPYKAITAHAWPLVADPAFFQMPATEKRAWLDQTVARQLSVDIATSDFSPLPVLGIPGWWDGQDAAFYADTDVFRLKRGGVL
jgi:hypothetical protein